MITFSLSPLSRSVLPSSAASVSTLVVSWKEAADRNESVFSDAFVIPRMISSAWAASPPFVDHFAVDPGVLVPVDELARQQVGVALLIDPDLLHHLAHDQLDVLVVDVHALGLVDVLDLADEVQLGLGPVTDRQQLVRVQRALVELGARLDLLTRFDVQQGAPRERVAVLLAALVGDHDRHRLVGRLDRDRAADLRDLRQALRLARLEQLDDARQALRDVGAGDAALVERPHRQLRARLADRLGGDDPDRIADLGDVAGRHRPSVARLADAGRRLALEHRADRDRDDLALRGLLGERRDDVGRLGAIDLHTLLDDHATAWPRSHARRSARSGRCWPIRSDAARASPGRSRARTPASRCTPRCRSPPDG